ncbi:MAG: YjgP/YjgQ family permease [Rickettsiales bacterium]|nr:YjgP/YjgQ family permease [Rickettsiales bacterium]
MKLYLKYTTITALKLFLIIVGALSLTATLIQVMLFLSVSINRLDLDIISMMKFMLLCLPAIFVYVSPIALICMALYYFHILFSDNELLTLELTGISKQQLALPIIFIMCATAMLSVIMCFFINPICKKQLLLQRKVLHEKVINAVLKEKTFTKVSNQLILYIEKRRDQKDLRGVIIYDKTKPAEVTTIFAQKAVLFDEGGKTMFKLYDGSRQTLVNNNLQTLYFKSLIFDISEYARKFTDSEKLLASQPMNKLIALRKKNNGDFKFQKRVSQEIHRRISWPLLNISLPILFLFSGLSYREYRSKSPKKVNIFISTTLCIVQMVLYFFLVNRIGTKSVFTLFTYGNILFFCGVGAFFLKKMYKIKTLL